MFVFGPVPSPRFGYSLCISNVEHGWCTYDCIFCQAGPTSHQGIRRSSFYTPPALAAEVERVLEQVQSRGECVEHLVISPDGEPGLDMDLGAALDALKCFGLPVVVMTNGSLLNRDDVRRDLHRADWISLKVDAGDQATWRKINRPHQVIRFGTVVQGMRAFAGQFDGYLSTETVLVDGVNTGCNALEATADLCACLKPDLAYLSAPTRPPSEPRCRPPSKTIMALAETIFSERMRTLVAPDIESGVPSLRGDPRRELLALVTGQPMKVSQVQRFLLRAGADPDLAEQLLRDELLCRMDHLGEPFYVRRRGSEGCEMRRCSICPAADPEAAAS